MAENITLRKEENCAIILSFWEHIMVNLPNVKKWVLQTFLIQPIFSLSYYVKLQQTFFTTQQSQLTFKGFYFIKKAAAIEVAGLAPKVFSARRTSFIKGHCSAKLLIIPSSRFITHCQNISQLRFYLCSQNLAARYRKPIIAK